MNKSLLKKILAAALGALILAAAFVCGFFLRDCTRGQAVGSYVWGIDTIKRNYYFSDGDEDFGGTALGAIADMYLDRYSEYYTAEEYAEVLKSNSGSKKGLGFSYSYLDGKGVYIASVVGNSPAYLSGLRAGERIVGGAFQGGEEVTFDSREKFSSFLASATGGEIRLVSDGGKTHVLTAAEYTASYAYLCTNKTSWGFTDSADGGLALKENAEDRISYLPDGAAYIRLAQFYGSASREFLSLAEKFNSLHCNALILDLRSNGGGYVRIMREIAGAFTDGERELAMLSRDKRGKEEKIYCTPVEDEARRIDGDVEIYVLANSATASASEALMGAMCCYGVLEKQNIFISDYSQEYLDWLEASGQEIKTRRTYGKGIMQSDFENPSTHEVLKLTTAKIFWPDGETSIHDVGFTADDGCTAIKADWQHTLPDDELKDAVEVIKSR